MVMYYVFIFYVYVFIFHKYKLENFKQNLHYYRKEVVEVEVEASPADTVYPHVSISTF